MPLTVIGRMVLDRWPDNFFAETEQVAFCPANIVPGIDFTNDPLLQGRLFSYLDTQLIAPRRPELPPDPDQRAEVPVRQPPARRPHADAGAEGPRHLRAEFARRPTRHARRRAGFRSLRRTAPTTGAKGRIRAESFADHYSQARLFFRSQTATGAGAHRLGAGVRAVQGGDAARARGASSAICATSTTTLAQRVADGLGLAALPPAPPAAVPRAGPAAVAARCRSSAR